jgi:parallel beta-helix repeat protein
MRSLAVVLGLFAFAKGLFYLLGLQRSSTSRARALSYVGVLNTFQHSVGSISRARALNQLCAGKNLQHSVGSISRARALNQLCAGAIQRYRASSISRARALSLLGIFMIISLAAINAVLPQSNNTAQAATSNQLNFQGRLLDASGSLVADGDYHIEFKLYDSLAAGASAQGVCVGGGTDDCLWVETRSTGNLVSVQNGYFSVYLGDVTALPTGIDWSQDLFLTMNVGGTGAVSWDGEMTPRFKLTAVPYAFRASNVASSDTSTALTDSDDVSITTGDATGTAANTGDIIIDTGSSSNGTAGQILLGTNNVSGLTLGRSGVTTTLQGSVSLTGAGTALTVTNNVTVNGNTTLGNATSDILTVEANATFNGTLTVSTGDTFINSGATLNTAISISDLPSGGDIGTAAATVDGATTFNINQTTSSQALTLPTPTNTTAGRVVYVNNVGTASFTMYGTTIGTSGSNAFIWNGSAWITTVSLSGSSVSVVGTLDSQTKSADGAVISGNAIYLQTADASNVGLVSTSSQTFAGLKTFNNGIVLAATQTLRVIGDTTANRPAGTAGEIYYDTDTNTLLTYNGTKWIADSGEYTIVAATDSTQAEKDSADYVADGTADQTEINSALTAASGGKVLLLAGTYTIDGTIAIPSNTTLQGIGSGSTIFSVAGAASFNMIENSDQAGGNNNITIKDLRIDGNEANVTSSRDSINLDNVGSGSGATTVKGFTISNVNIVDSDGDGISLNNVSNGILENSSVVNSKGSRGVEILTGFNIQVNNNNISGNGDTNILLSATQDSSVTSNTFNSAAGLGGQSVHIQNGSTENVISSNIINNNSNYGIYISSGGSTPSRNTISNNVIHDNTDSGISVGTGLTTLIIGNNFNDNDSTGTGDSILLSNADYAQVIGNYIAEADGTTAINITASTTDAYIADNKIDSTNGISDSGTDTIYGGQMDASGNFSLQAASGSSIDLLSNTDITGNLTVSGNTTLGDAAGDTLTVNGSSITFANGFTSCTAINTDASGVLGCDTATYLTSANAFVQGGNTFGAAAVLGTNDSNSLTLRTNSTAALTIDALQNSSFAGSLTVNATSSAAIAGTGAASGTTALTGTSTTFLSSLEIGDRITVNGETKMITAIASDTSLTVDSAFTTFTGQTITRLPVAFNVFTSSGAYPSLSVTDQGAVRVRNTTDSSSGFIVLNAANETLFRADTTNTWLITDADLSIDDSGQNDGDTSRALHFGGATSGEAIASKRTATGNQYGLDFYTGGNARLQIANGGALTLNGNTTISGSNTLSVGTGATTLGGTLQVTGLTTLNGGLTVEAGDTFTFNGDAFTDFTGGGLYNNSGVLSVDNNTATGFFQNGGNDFGGNATLGTNTAGQTLSLETANTTRFTIDSAASTITGNGATSLLGGTTLNLGSTGANAVTLATNASTRFTVSASASTLTGSGATTITGGSTLTLGSTLTGSLNIDTGTTGAINIGTNTSAKTLNLGTGSTGVKTINIGGTAANVIGIGNTQTAGSISLGAALTTGTINIGGTGAQTGAINLGVGTGAQTISLGTGAAAKTVVLGSNTAGSTTTIQGANSIALNSGTVSTNATTVALFNSTATTVNAFGAATALELGATTGATSINNGLGVDGNTTLGDASGDTLTVNGSSITFANGFTSCTVINTNASGVLGCNTATLLTNSLTDNVTDAFDLQEGTNNYININTTNSSENISFGNATTNPSYNFLGSGTLTVSGDSQFNGNLVVAAGQSIILTGSGTLPVSPTEGEIYYDSTNNQLLIYNGTQWEQLNGDASNTYVVAASDSLRPYLANYRGDGTADDVQINLALDAANTAGGGTVYLMEGTYDITAALTIDDNITLVGAGDATILSSDTDAPTASFDLIENEDISGGNTNITVRNLQINGNNATVTGTRNSIEFEKVGSGSGNSATIGAVVDSVTIVDAENVGIQYDTVMNGTITNVKVVDASYGIQLTDSVRVTISDSQISGTSGQAIELVDSNSEIVVDGNIIEGVGGSAHGIRASILQHSVISNNIIRNNTGRGILIGSGSTSQYNVISGNYISGSGEHGISFLGNYYHFTITGNSIYDNDDSGTGAGIDIAGTGADVFIQGNYFRDINDGSYAISVAASASDVYLADNTMTNTAGISDSGTNTVYANQLNADIDDAGADLVLQAPDSIQLLSNTDITGTLTVSGNTTLGDASGDTLTVNGSSITFANGFTSCTVINTNASGVLGCNTATLLTNSLTDNVTDAFDLQEGTNNYININTTNSSENISFGNATTNPSYNFLGSGTLTVSGDSQFNGNLVVAAGQSLTLTGGNTASRPGSPTEGMLYFDTDTDRLLTYANGKWRADSGEYTIVAATDSTQAEKDSADYVADGTADQTEINSALTAASGGKVLLLAGTYTVSGTITIPSNTTLQGIGSGSTIFSVAGSSSFNLIENSDQTGGNNNITIRNLKIDGNKSNVTGTRDSIEFDEVGSGTGTSAVIGFTIDSVNIVNSRTNGIELIDVSNSSVLNSSAINGNNIGVNISTAYGLRIANNDFSGNAGGENLQLTTVQDSTVSGNILNGQTVAGSGSLHINGSSTENTINNNIINNNVGRGVYISGSTSRNTLSNNVIHDNSQDGLELASAISYSVIGNNFNDNDSGGTGSSIFLNNADNAIIANNFINESGGTEAITISASSDNAYVVGNNITGSGGIDDSGTNTTYAGQEDSSGNLMLQAESGNTIDLLSNTDITGTLTVSGLTTLNGGLTVEAGDTFTFNGDAFTDFTGGGLYNNSGVLSVDTTGATGFFQNGGNAFTATSTLGNTGNYNLDVITNNVTRLTVQSDGDIDFDSNTLYIDASANGVVLGGTDGTGGKLTINDGRLLINGTTTSNNAIYLNQTIQSTSNSNQYILQNQSTFDLTNVSGGTLGTATAFLNIAEAGGTGTVTDLRGSLSRVDQTGAAVVTNSYAHYIGNGTSTPTSNKYGLYVENITGAAGTNYPLYLRSSSGSYPLLTVTNTGASLFQNSTNSTSAYQFKTIGAGTNRTLLNVDTTNELLTVTGTIFDSATVQNFTGSANITQSNIDSRGTILISSNASGYTATLTDPTVTTAGRLVYVTNTGAYDMTLAANAGGSAQAVTLKPYTSATMIWNGSDWTAAGASSSTDLQAAYNNTATSAGGAELVLNAAGGAADGLTIRNNPTTPITGGILEVQSAIGTNLFSVNNLAPEFAANGGAEESTTFATNWTAAPGGGTVTRTTTGANVATGQGAVQVVTTTTNHGVRNNLASNPDFSTTYQVSFAALASSGSFSTLEVLYSRNGGTNTIACTDPSGATTVNSTEWSKITCQFTTDGSTVTNADLIIRQTDATGRTFYIDNLSIVENSASSQPDNVQIGGGIKGGPVTLFTLDRSSSPPVANGNDVYLGSMYYDTTSGRIQCYEADGWGACGSAPNNYVNLTPEYPGSVLNGTGVGTMTADFCADESGVLQVNTGFCASGESKNYYNWTSPQATEQEYSIYITYQLPAAFKAFDNNDTVQLTARTDNTTNGTVTYEMFRNEGGAIAACGTETTVTTIVDTWQTVGINGNEADGCGFTSASADNFVIFKINMKASNNANVYSSTLSFTTIGQ